MRSTLTRVPETVKPEPVTVTVLPGGPETGEREIEGAGGGGPVTAKVALAVPNRVPSLAITVNSPGGTESGTVNVVENEPDEPATTLATVFVGRFDMLHRREATGQERTIVIVELGVKPEPVTLTDVPAGPCVGASTIWREGGPNTVKGNDDPVMPEREAEIIADPALTRVTRPALPAALETVATEGLDDDQTTCVVRSCFEPSENMPRAESWNVIPTV